MNRTDLVTALMLPMLALTGCGGSSEPDRVSLPIESDGAAFASTTSDLGYVITLKQARISITGLQFTVRGEAHASWWHRLVEAIVPTAHAHPGHLAGGEVTGELGGPIVLTFGAGAPVALGQGTFLAGAYNGMNLGFDVALDGGHTAVLEGTASRDGREIAFTANLDVAPGTQLVGAPFSFDVTKDTRATVTVRLLPKDPDGPETLFDLIDFATLDPAGNGAVAIEPGSEAANVMRRALQSHVFYAVQAR